MLRDVSRLGNDNHSQITRIKKPELHQAWDLGLGTLGLDDWDVSINEINYIL